MPPSYLALVNQHGKEPGMVRRMNSLRMLWDMEARVEMLNAWPEVQQVISLAVPSPEMLGGPEESPGYARVANEGMADICRRWPDKFPAFVASLPMNNPAAALVEMDHAIEMLGAKGIQILAASKWASIHRGFATGTLRHSHPHKICNGLRRRLLFAAPLRIGARNHLLPGASRCQTQQAVAPPG